MSQVKLENGLKDYILGLVHMDSVQQVSSYTRSPYNSKNAVPDSLKQEEDPIEEME